MVTTELWLSDEAVMLSNTAVLELGRLSRCKLVTQPCDLNAHVREDSFQGLILSLHDLNSFLTSRLKPSILRKCLRADFAALELLRAD